MESLNFQASTPIPISSPHNYRKIKVGVKTEDDSLCSPRNSFPLSPPNNVTNNSNINDNNTENKSVLALDDSNNKIQSSPPLDSNLFPNLLFGTSWSSSSSWADIVEEEELKERKENESESNLGEKRKSKEEGGEKKKKKKKKSESKKKQHELRKVFVGNLLFSKSNKEVPLSEKEEDELRKKSIESIFSQFGSILKIIPFWLDKKDFMEVDTEKTKTTSHCFVLFASKHAAERSVKYLADFDRRVKVCKKIGKRKPLPSFYVRLCNEAENIINENSKAQTTIPSNSNTTPNTETTQIIQTEQSTETTTTQTTRSTETTETTSHSTETESTAEMVDT